MSTADKRPACQSCKVHWMDLNMDLVPFAATGGEKILAELAADIGDVNIDEIGKGVVLLVEKMFVDHGAGDELALVHGEKFHQCIFARGEGDGLAVFMH